MKKLLLVSLALFATSAFAALLVPDNVNTNANSQGQNQGQGQAQLQGQLQGQGQVQGIISSIDNDIRTRAEAFAGSAAKSNSGGNTQAIVVEAAERMDYSGSYTVKNVPAALAPNVYPTSPCMGSTSVGASGIGFGISFGSSWTDDECGIRETARSFYGMELKQDALKVLCSSKYAAVAPSCLSVQPLPAK